MAFRRTLLLSILSALCTTADSFSVRCPSWAVISTTPVRSLPTSATCLFAEEDNETEASGNDEPTESGETAEPEEAEAASNADTDILSSPAFLKRKIEVLKSDVAATENEIEEARERAEAGKAEWGPQLDDLRKEYKNIQERMTNQSEAKDMEVTRSVVREMLDFLDNFDRAFGAVTAETEEEKAIEAEYKEAYQMTMDVIASLGVEEVQTVGSEFDYELHQAVMQKPSDEYEEGIVCEELQKGFKIGDTLIRAAMVVVAV